MAVVKKPNGCASSASTRTGQLPMHEGTSGLKSSECLKQHGKPLAGVSLVSEIERFSDTRPAGLRPRFPAGGDCPKKVSRSRSVEQLRHSRFPYGQRVTLTPVGLGADKD